MRLGLLEARYDQPHHRARDQEHQERDHDQPKDHAWIGKPEAAGWRRGGKERFGGGGHREYPSRKLGLFPSPSWGGVRGAGPAWLNGWRTKLRPPSLALPHKGGGNTPSAGRGRTPYTARERITHQTCRATA